MKSSNLIVYRRFLARHDEFEKAYRFINKANQLYKLPELAKDAELAYKQVAHIFEPGLYKSFYGKIQVENPVPLERVFVDATFPDRLRWVKRLLPKYNTKTILDIGCSEGSYSLNLAKEGYQVIGINLFEESIKIANDRAEATRVPARFIQGDFMEMTLKEKDKFDAVLLFEVLEHVPNPEATIKKCIELANSKGIVYISTPNGTADESATALGVDLENAKGHEFKGHVRVYTEKTLRELVKDYEILDFYHSETDLIKLLHIAFRRRSNGKKET